MSRTTPKTGRLMKACPHEFGEAEKSVVMTAAELNNRTVRDLATMAKKKKVPGWHAMKKDELVKALLRQLPAEQSRRVRNTRSQPSAPHSRVSERLKQIKSKVAEAKDLTFRSVIDEGSQVKDRLIVMVRDPYWLHAYWELSRRSIERAKVALGPYWHGARPVLRLYEVLRDGTTTSTRQAIRDVDIHGGVNNWYIDVHNPPKNYQLDIGYLASSVKFFCLARSNVVSTPAATGGESFDQNWAEIGKEFDRIFALSGGYSEPAASSELKEVLEERLQRPMADSAVGRFGYGAAGRPADGPDFDFQVDTELIVHGVANLIWIR